MITVQRQKTGTSKPFFDARPLWFLDKFCYMYLECYYSDFYCPKLFYEKIQLQIVRECYLRFNLKIFNQGFLSPSLFRAYRQLIKIDECLICKSSAFLTPPIYKHANEYGMLRIAQRNKNAHVFIIQRFILWGLPKTLHHQNIIIKISV